MSLNSVTKLKGKVDEMQAAAERARGAVETLRKTLEDDWGCKKLADGRTLLETLQKEEAELREEFNAKLVAFEEEFEDELVGTVLAVSKEVTQPVVNILPNC